MDPSAGSPSRECLASTKDGAQSGTVDTAVRACRYPQVFERVSALTANQPFPFRHPLIQPVNDVQGHAQAQEVR
eukprot:2926136-Pyramimonas_sp.AAC.1